MKKQGVMLASRRSLSWASVPASGQVLESMRLNVHDQVATQVAEQVRESVLYPVPTQLMNQLLDRVLSQARSTYCPQKAKS